MDGIAKIYIRHIHGKYRIKVFEKSIGIERQLPREDNVLFDRSRYPKLYDESDGSWNINSFNFLINDYEHYIYDVNTKLNEQMN